jgi:hypothetical protein
MEDFRERFEAFCKLFNGERNYIVPLMSLNTQGITEVQQQCRQLVEASNSLCRINYIFHSQKHFLIDDLVLPLSEFTTLGVATTLRQFVRPNHKDRYSHLIQFLVTNPSVFSQIIYFLLVQTDLTDSTGFTISSDDCAFFCFNTFPSLFLYFLTPEARRYGISCICAGLKLHFFLHGHRFGFRHNFLKDLVFSFFLTTNPGRFFEAAVLPLIPFFEFISEDRELKYPATIPLVRSRYWQQVCRFVSSLLERFKQSVTLLPEGARELANAILNLEPTFPELKYILIIESFICRYLTRYIRFPEKPILSDAARVLLCVCPMPTGLQRDLEKILQEERLELDSFFEALRPTSQPPDGVDDAFEISGRLTALTTRDLYLVFKGAQRFQDFVPEDRKKTLARHLAGIMLPKTVTDRDFLELRIMPVETTISEIVMKPTQPYDDLVDLLTFVDPHALNYTTPVELHHQILTMCSPFISPTLEQKLTPALFMNTAGIEEVIIENRVAMKKFEERLGRALFATRNESARLRVQLASLLEILARTHLVPALTELYPLDFMVRGEDLFDPQAAYGRLIANVSHRITSLKLTADNQSLVRRAFFLDFVDKIDVCFDFQKMIVTDRSTEKFSTFCQDNSQAVQSLTEGKTAVLGRSATIFQGVRRTHSISYNLCVALKAIRPLTIIPPIGVAMAVAMSGNGHVSGFVYFVMKYLRDERIVSVIMTDEESNFIDRLCRAISMIDGLQAKPRVVTRR